MESLYIFIGKIFVWLSIISVNIALFFYISKFVFDKVLIKTWKLYWYLVEFIVYRKRFKEYIKDKERHNKIEQ